VRDIDDADVIRPEPAQRLEQPLDVGLGQGRGRLVKDQNFRLDRERPADPDQRALSGGQCGYRRVRVNVAAEDGERGRRRLAHLPPGNDPELRARIAGLNRDVFGDRHPLDEPEILVDERNRSGRSSLRLPAADPDLARVGFVHARQNLDQGRLAGAVLSEQRMHLAATDVEVDLIEGQSRGEMLDDAPHLQKGRRIAGSGLLGNLHDGAPSSVLILRRPLP